MTVKDIFKKVKAIFDAATPDTTPTDVAPADTTINTTFSYPITGGSSVYVDCSDDGLADIDTGDKVYTDPALTIPYPDGSYQVTGTNFSFAVASGIVGLVTDVDGTGPGLPLEQSAATDTNQMAKPAIPPAPPAPPATPVTQPNTMASAKTPEEITALYESFANGIVDPANIAVVLKALMENCFGWQIREQQQQATAQQAINIYKQDLTTAQVAMAAQDKLVTKHEETIKGLFELIEKLVEMPAEDPKTLSAAKKERFDRSKSKEAGLEAIADAIKKMKKK